MASFHLAKAQDKQYQEIEELNQSAHDRYMARARRGIEANPNSVSPWEKKNILDYHRNQQETHALRAHERWMLEQQGRNELGVAEQKKLGMIGQGSEAAKANANATVETAKIDSETKKYGFDTQKTIEEGHDKTKLTEAEKKIAGDLELEKQKGANAESVADATGEWGYKTAVDTEKAKGESATKVARTNAEAATEASRRKHADDMELQGLKNAGSAQMLKAFTEMRKSPRYKNRTDDELWAMIRAGVQ